MRKKSKSEVLNINDAPQTENSQAYVTWGEDVASRQNALNESSKSLDEYGVVNKTFGNSRYRTNFSNLDNGVSSRPGLTRSDYDVFRPSESVPQKLKDIIKYADNIYHKIGLVKNVIDLMGDFACQGIRISHPNKRIERFFRNWFEKINGYDRSERFLNNLYRTGNVVINRQTAKISLKIADKMYKTSGNADILVSSDDSNVEKREIPWKYTFIDPFYVDVVGSSLAAFSGQKIYAINMPPALRKIINNPKNDIEKQIIQNLPQTLRDAAQTKKPYLLDKDKTVVFHYKKDDWSTWAYPMIYSIMDDLFIVEKLKLADLAALDGAISNIRIFKLGSLDHKIAPTQAATAKLASILQNNVGGGTMDLVWGPDIELLESKTNVHQFLGEGKYTPHLNSIYAGLGIPPTLTGTYGAAGTTNNFISLKTLTQRLQYGRKILISFWNHEIAMIQKAMGFRYPAKIEFDRMDLSNEEAEKALLIQLADRNIVSDEMLQTSFGIDSDLEKTRIKKESVDREADRYHDKSGPFYRPEFKKDLQKIALQTGLATPSQVGLELPEKKKGEKTLVDLKNKTEKPKINTQDPTITGIPQQGRPRNSKDSEQRKTKDFKPQTGASLEIWTLNAIESINKIMNPEFIKFYNKKNMRSLSSSEYSESEETKTKILLSLPIYSVVNEKVIESCLDLINKENCCKIYSSFIKTVNKSRAEVGRVLTNEEINLIKIITIAAHNNL